MNTINNLLLFTEKLAKEKKEPTSLRDGTPLDFFKYTPGDVFPFAGVTRDGRALNWNKYGHLNGNKRKMKTDLIYEPMDQDEHVVIIGRTYNGNNYAFNPGGELMKSSYQPYQFILNIKTGAVRNGKILPYVKIENQANEKK